MIGARLLLLTSALAFTTGCATVRSKLQDLGIFIAPPATNVAELGTAVTGCSAAEKASYEMDAEREYFFGRAIGARLLGDLNAQPLAPDHPVARYVDRVGQLLALATQVQGEATVADRARHDFSRLVEDRPWPLTGYHFVVIPLEEPNAFGSPGGLVTVTTGLLQQLQSEDELAGVLAHELVHVQRGHGVEVMKAHLCQSSAQGKVAQKVGDEVDQAVNNVGNSLGGAAFANKSDTELGELLEVAVKGILGTLTRGYPKELELEADRMALRLMVSAGYSPSALDVLLFRMKSAAKGRDKYMDTHPPFDDRLKTVRPALARFSADQQQRPEAEVKLRTARFTAAMKELPAPVPQQRASTK